MMGPLGEIKVFSYLFPLGRSLVSRGIQQSQGRLGGRGDDEGPIQCWSKFVFAICPFTGKGLLPMQLGMEKAGGKGRYGREQVKCTSPWYFRACFTVYFTPVMKGTLGKHKR